jgi:hypothetical protein
MVVARVCRGPAGCKTEGGKVACGDMAVAEATDPCIGDIFACSVDHKRLLRCKDGQFAVGASCRCVVKGDIVKCQ